MTPRKNNSVDIKQLLGWLAFSIQFLVLLSTIIWKGSSIQTQVEMMQKQIDRQQALLDQYFHR
jgi:hypothetical protein